MAKGSGSPERRRPFSLAGRLVLGSAIGLVAMSAIAAAASTVPLPAWQVFLLALLVGLPIATWWVGRLLAPVERLLAALADGIRSFRDRDFSVRLNAARRDELGDLARHYNEVAETLRRERAQVRERELLLQSALDESPAAIVLVGPTERVLYANREAGRLLVGGRRLGGERFDELAAGCPKEMRRLLEEGLDGLFGVEEEDGESETYQLAQRTFHLNRHRHRLVLLRRLTSELGRREAEAWKKVIRILSHELNNSLAPVSSLLHSASVLLDEPGGSERAAALLATVDERVGQLVGFLEGYARFARLPRPQRDAVEWRPFLAAARELLAFELDGEPPQRPGWFDRGQMEQVLINLVKNAREASEDGAPPIRVRVVDRPDGGALLQVLDRGRGMEPEVLSRALLPFYSTKRAGSGLGLALCREIVEAHGGRLGLAARRGGGTVVSCWLPPAPPAARHADDDRASALR